jgi:hypothetical protein
MGLNEAQLAEERQTRRNIQSEHKSGLEKIDTKGHWEMIVEERSGFVRLVVEIQKVNKSSYY